MLSVQLTKWFSFYSSIDGIQKHSNSWRINLSLLNIYWGGWITLDSTGCEKLESVFYNEIRNITWFMTSHFQFEVASSKYFRFLEEKQRRFQCNNQKRLRYEKRHNLSLMSLSCILNEALSHSLCGRLKGKIGEWSFNSELSVLVDSFNICWCSTPIHQMQTTMRYQQQRQRTKFSYKSQVLYPFRSDISTSGRCAKQPEYSPQFPSCREIVRFFFDRQSVKVNREHILDIVIFLFQTTVHTI